MKKNENSESGDEPGMACMCEKTSLCDCIRTAGTNLIVVAGTIAAHSDGHVRIEADWTLVLAVNGFSSFVYTTRHGWSFDSGLLKPGAVACDCTDGVCTCVRGSDKIIKIGAAYSLHRDGAITVKTSAVFSLTATRTEDGASWHLGYNGRSWKARPAD